MNNRLLAFFEEQPSAFLSGEMLSERLQVTRTAVWKHIQELKKMGYRFESVPRRGYRLIGKPDMISASHIVREAQGLSIFRKLMLHKELDSTQSEAHRLAAAGESHGTLIITECQTSGRGRHGKSWYSPAGKGVWMSLLLEPTMPIAFASQMTLLTAVSLCRTVRKNYQTDVGIKWPNDLLIGNKKISGILVESVGEDERVQYMVIGVGIDCNLLPEDYPAELADKATSLFIETGELVDRSAIIAAFLREFDELYKLYIEFGFAPIRILWESLSLTLGQAVKLKSGQGDIEGIAEAMDEMGALIIRLENGEIQRVYSVEITP